MEAKKPRLSTVMSDADYNTDPVTLSRFIMEDDHERRKLYGKTRTSLSFILGAIGVAAKVTANAVQNAGMQGLYALGGGANQSGEDQKKLDVLANDVFVNVLRNTKKVRVMVSEELDEPIVVEGLEHARYVCVFDPLDGSSNIECNVSVGTIFGIYHTDDKSLADLSDGLRPGREMVAAGYILYSSSVVMVLSTGHGVHMFTLDPTFGEFVMTRRDWHMPSVPKKIYSCNTGNAQKWDLATRHFLRHIREEVGGYSARYVGSMVTDVHRTLLYGGIFMYPADKKNKRGKLRLLYECFPMAYLMEAAGGMATDGKTPILDIQPKDIHERCPIYLGCTRDVEKLLEFVKLQDEGKLEEPGTVI
ncbi:fructose-1,6-bisphosphatase [Salpingoeca rosetta]|uniref:fructose-bisphosphatase n=1 Tax=Salpingoeca rosetta (strain ATCC 50818 / BSB-021) TaxID=946362 RepID=F2UKD0_SALR5|nr:fructose-1,6-bisphosphatase [Salpingoeca rosetta]EGD77579.1 fructose-1,6-bisphosphatase [Salpingoeca rosetta]|eukprot:XP_004990467.1 fructose-1,6-bisphosphatase [Salpingoeca rosetta]